MIDTNRLFLHCHLRANREEVPPSSIPNLEVKLFFADDTATFRCGKVGRCGDESVKENEFYCFLFLPCKF